MSRFLLKKLLITTGVICGLTHVPITAYAQSGDRTIDIGENLNGDICTANLNWNDPSLGDSNIKFSDSYSINCRGSVVQAQALGRIRKFSDQVSRDNFNGSLECASQTEIMLEGFRNATASRCVDAALGLSTVVVNAERGNDFYQFSAVPNVVSVAYQGMRIVSGQRKTTDISLFNRELNISDLENVDTSNIQTTSVKTIESRDALLSRGAVLNSRGLHADASRYLSAVLETSDVDDQINRLELLLEAALADSNIKFFRSADEKFARARDSLSELNNIEVNDIRRKFEIYNGLHALNKRDFETAKKQFTALLDNSDGQQNLLADPNTFVKLNILDYDTDNIIGAISLPDERLLKDNFLLAYTAWGLSVAELALDNRGLSEKALDTAEDRFSLFNSLAGQTNINDSSVYWLAARLDRQRGRLHALAENYDAAINAFDRGIASLRSRTQGAELRNNDPIVGEFQLEKAALMYRAGKSKVEIDSAYQTAVDSLLDVRSESYAFSTTALRPYFTSMLEKVRAGDETARDAYFKALQIKNESGAAKQLSQLQTINNLDNVSSENLRNLERLEQEISSLSFKISEGSVRGVDVSDIVSERQSLQSNYFELEAELQSVQGNSAVNRTDNAGPASLPEIQSYLREGEAYLKFNVVGDQIYGALIDNETIYAFSPSAKFSEIRPSIEALRLSIDGTIEDEIVPEYDVIRSVIVYKALFSEINDVLRQQDGSFNELIVDAAPVLQGLSSAILVSDATGGQKFIRQSDRLDYRNLEFMANWISSSVAISPTSFIASRQLNTSTASQAFIGFAAPNSIRSEASFGRNVQIGPCLISPQKFRELGSRFAEIPDTEIGLAAKALGLGDDYNIVRADEFTDSSLISRGRPGGDLSNYKVLHFATHGLTEGQFGCPDSPAALLTSRGSDGSDMLLSFDEIARLNLDANLVVLSACETASQIGEKSLRLSGETVPGATLEGLVRAFFSANSRSVLATYWESSNSGESEKFMEAFYEYGRNDSISTALNKAQMKMLTDKDTSHPFYWGGFFVVGDTGKNMLSGS